MEVIVLLFFIMVMCGLKGRNTNMAGPGSGLPPWIDGWTKDIRVLIYPVIAVAALLALWIIGVLIVLIWTAAASLF